MSAQREQNSFTTFKPPSMEGLKPHLDIGAIDITMPSPPARQSFWRRFITLMDVSLLKDPGYLNILFGLSIFYVAEMNFKMITPFFFVSLGYRWAYFHNLHTRISWKWGTNRINFLWLQQNRRRLLLIDHSHFGYFIAYHFTTDLWSVCHQKTYHILCVCTFCRCYAIE